jgi:hypothetical protein
MSGERTGNMYSLFAGYYIYTCDLLHLGATKMMGSHHRQGRGKDALTPRRNLRFSELNHYPRLNGRMPVCTSHAFNRMDWMEARISALCRKTSSPYPQVYHASNDLADLRLSRVQFTKCVPKSKKIPGNA